MQPSQGRVSEVSHGSVAKLKIGLVPYPELRPRPESNSHQAKPPMRRTIYLSPQHHRARKAYLQGHKIST